MDMKNKRCTGVNRVEFKYDVINTITNVTQESYKMKHFRHNYEFCQGKFISDKNFKVTQKGILMNFTNIEIERYIYNDFCVDVDFESGRSVFIICENFKKIKKCCKLNQILKKTDGRFECIESLNVMNIADFHPIIKTDDRLPNIEFITENSINLEEYLFEMHVSDGTIKKLNENSSICIDKLSNGEWIQLDTKKHSESIGSWIWVSILGLVLILLILLIIYCFKKFTRRKRNTSDNNEENGIPLAPNYKTNKEIKENTKEKRKPKENGATSRSETEPLFDTKGKSNGGINEDPHDNGEEELSELPNVREIAKIFEPNQSNEK
jgi:uncharacterized membrane protein